MTKNKEPHIISFIAKVISLGALILVYGFMTFISLFIPDALLLNAGLVIFFMVIPYIIYKAVPDVKTITIFTVIYILLTAWNLVLVCINIFAIILSLIIIIMYLLIFRTVSKIKEFIKAPSAESFT